MSTCKCMICQEEEMAAKFLGKVGNSEDTKRLGEEGITFNEARALVHQFEEFNPFHILPENRARKYIEENWGGRLLNTFHFGFKPRKKREPKEAQNEQVQQGNSSKPRD